MELMKNKYLKFPNILFNNNLVKNITAKNILPDIPEIYKSDDYVRTIKIEDNRLIESISFEIYGSTDYWDLLFSLNDITNFSQLPVDYDHILIRARKELSKWMSQGKMIISRNLDEQYSELLNILNRGIVVKLEKSEGDIDEIVKAKYIEILENEIEKNEKNRILKYISIEDMSELESFLLVSSQKTKINQNILINKNDII